MNASLVWNSNMSFTCDNHGLKTEIDASKEHGGTEKGPNPKELVLNAMMGCTAMDVVSMLTKMRQEITEFKMDIEAVKTTVHPTHFKSAVLFFYLKGNILPEKAIQSVNASLTKYCGVNYMMSKTCEITYKLFLNDAEIQSGTTGFSFNQ
jgi:putative redox protein